MKLKTKQNGTWAEGSELGRGISLMLIICSLATRTASLGLYHLQDGENEDELTWVFLMVPITYI